MSMQCPSQDDRQLVLGFPAEVYLHGLVQTRHGLGLRVCGKSLPGFELDQFSN